MAVGAGAGVVLWDLEVDVVSSRQPNQPGVLHVDVDVVDDDDTDVVLL